MLFAEYDSLTRLGMADVRNTIKKRLKGEQLVMLSACCVGPAIQDQVSASIEDALTNHTWVDVKVSGWGETLLSVCWWIDR